MARTVENEEERERRIILVGEYVKETGASTRKTAEYFSKTYFKISNCTVSDYCARYCKMRPDELELLRGKIESNMDLGVSDPKVRQRVELNVSLFEQGLTIQEIAEKTNTSFWTVYRDVSYRYQIIDPVGFEEIKHKLSENSHDPKWRSKS